MPCKKWTSMPLHDAPLLRVTSRGGGMKRWRLIFSATSVSGPDPVCWASANALLSCFAMKTVHVHSAWYCTSHALGARSLLLAVVCISSADARCSARRSCPAFADVVHRPADNATRRGMLCLQAAIHRHAGHVFRQRPVLIPGHKQNGLAKVCRVFHLTATSMKACRIPCQLGQ